MAISRRIGDVARIYVGNTPIRLEIAKVKQEETEILFELSDRREGTLTELSNRYGLENLELAYNASGTFLGYGWSKGWLDSLRAKQEAGEWIDLIYEDQVLLERRSGIGFQIRRTHSTAIFQVHRCACMMRSR